MDLALASLGQLFDTSDFPARWNCGHWSPVHGWFHIIADLAIAAAYSVIPVALAGYWLLKRGELVFPRLFWLFAAFIFSCGSTHVIEAIIFYHPIYRFSALMKVVTAVASWSTVIALLRIAPQAIQLPGLQRANANLEEQLQKTRLAESALERSNRDLEAFTGMVTHDLRNPLNSALFTTELARESAERSGNPVLAGQLGQAVQSLRQMEALIRELHADALLRNKTGEMKAVILDDVVKSAKLNLAPLVADRQARIEVGALPEVRGSYTMLVQLFINLMENAIKYAGIGVPFISIAGELKPDGRIAVRISDRGVGVPAEALEAIFESGARGENALHLPGNGLGLAYARRIMEAHGGTITAETVSEGAAFVLEFPAIPEVVETGALPA
ncbi:HAMP domain-containing histidine kinase [Luteolibacter flavescens]|uniref:histidine kinase n=1 Tax=Luteolibacter flavescens TaxID=1859460 RepID=A0ABT3FK18_9BACT|nr:HAMP domain-containing sensor histidine kinase [Luteolibacter flavescens]MCW1883564.1 HAMP domain-containing histidine kinase [Luteolibacter flavescens]